MAITDGVAVIEHGWTWEVKAASEWSPLRPVEFSVWRLSCACGYATHWFRDQYLARSMADGHALQGQLSAFG